MSFLRAWTSCTTLVSGTIVCYYFFIGQNWWRCHEFVNHCLQVCQGLPAEWLKSWWACLGCCHRKSGAYNQQGLISCFVKEDSPRPKCWLTRDLVSLDLLIHFSLCPPRTEQWGAFLGSLNNTNSIFGDPNLPSPAHPKHYLQIPSHLGTGFQNICFLLGKNTDIHFPQGTRVLLIYLTSVILLHTSLVQKYLEKMLESACEWDCGTPPPASSLKTQDSRWSNAVQSVFLRGHCGWMNAGWLDSKYLILDSDYFILTFQSSKYFYAGSSLHHKNNSLNGSVYTCNCVI